MTLVDGRSSKIVLVAHCLLNANARAQGAAWYAGVHAVIGELAGRGYSIVQLPCPEGLHVGPGHESLDVAVIESVEYRELCTRLANDVAEEAERFMHAGVQTVAVVGIEGSPSCGVHGPTGTGTGADSASGVFMAALRERLEPQGVKFLAISHALPEDNMRVVVESLR